MFLSSEKYTITLYAISGHTSSSASKSSKEYLKSINSSTQTNNFESVFAVFFPTPEIQREVRSSLIFTCFAHSTASMRLFTDFSLNHSSLRISSALSAILKTSTKSEIIHSFRNISTCLSQKPSILNPCFPTAKAICSDTCAGQERTFGQ